jgi:hypothetical protein
VALDRLDPAIGALVADPQNVAGRLPSVPRSWETMLAVASWTDLPSRVKWSSPDGSWVCWS